MVAIKFHWFSPNARKKKKFDKEGWISRFNAHALISVCSLLHHGVGTLNDHFDDLPRELQPLHHNVSD